LRSNSAPSRLPATPRAARFNAATAFLLRVWFAAARAPPPGSSTGAYCTLAALSLPTALLPHAHCYIQRIAAAFAHRTCLCLSKPHTLCCHACLRTCERASAAATSPLFFLHHTCAASRCTHLQFSHPNIPHCACTPLPCMLHFLPLGCSLLLCAAFSTCCYLLPTLGDRLLRSAYLPATSLLPACAAATITFLLFSLTLSSLLYRTTPTSTVASALSPHIPAAAHHHTAHYLPHTARPIPLFLPHTTVLVYLCLVALATLRTHLHSPPHLPHSASFHLYLHSPLVAPAGFVFCHNAVSCRATASAQATERCAQRACLDSLRLSDNNASHCGYAWQPSHLP